MTALTFSCAPYLREIGRGKDGSRALDRDAAATLMAAILDGQVSDLELGGVLLAMRMKGEAAVEIDGFLDAIDRHVAPIQSSGKTPVVIIPTYNGARHAPNLVPLLAWLLVREGVPVLLHGQSSDPAAQGAGSNVTRVPTVDILHHLGIAPCTTAGEASARLAAEGLAYVPLAVAGPGLARLIGLRRVLGVRNVAHTLAKLLRPVSGPTLLLSAYTHPEFGAMLAELFAMRAEPALLMRGTEGEAVANVRRPQRIVQWLGGVETTVVDGADASLPQHPDLPERDAASTAAWIRAVQAGDVPAPAALLAQRDAVLATLAALRGAA